MALKGTLDDFELTDVLQIIQMGGKDGVLRVFHPSGSKASIYIEKNTVVHAICDNEIGDIAITKIFTWGEGEFEFVTGEKAPEKTMDIGIPALIMEAARKIDEWNRIKKVIPSLDIVLEIEPNPDTDVEEINLTANEWRVLSQVDGEKSIKQIARALKIGEIETAKIVFGLLGSGLIRIKTAKESAPKVTEKKAEEPEKEEKKEEEKKGKGFFDFFKKK